VSDDNAPLHKESGPERLRRWVLASAYALRGKRIHILPRAAVLNAEWMLRPQLARARFTSAESGRHELAAVVDDLSVETMLAGFRRGLYPMAHMGPMKWWSPDVRAVIDPANTHIDKNTKRILRQGKWNITFDRDFQGVLLGCAGPRIGRAPLTWLTPRMMPAFIDLHKAGYAHSVEIRDQNGELAGGLFGVAIGGVFFGQSQFTIQRDASKAAVAVLHKHLANWGFKVRDGQRITAHLETFGFAPVARAEFQSLIAQHVDHELNAPWTFDATLEMDN
jgi:leucyl/phenylalanyl-tRNA--protein transferase